METWPPPTDGMSLDELSKQNQIARDYVNHTYKEFMELCKNLGHDFGKSKPAIIVKKDGFWIEYESDGSFASTSGYWEGREEVRGFERTCQICGIVEKKEAITEYVNPFENKP